MLVGKAIYNLLSNNANVSALVSTRVYPEVAHQQDVAPYIVYNVRSNEPSDTQLSPSTLDTASIEVNCYAATYETAIAISVAVRGTLDRVQGTYAGVNVQSCQYQSELMNFEEPRRLYVVTADYQVRILRTNVTIPQVMIEAGVYNLDDLSDVNVPAPTDGQALVYDAATSQWVAGDAASALADLTDVALDEPLDREALVYDEATTSWINGGPAKVDFPVFNNSGSQISKGKVVRFAGGAQGDRPTVALFSASSTSQLTTLVGVAMEDIPTGQPGHVRSYGTIYGVNTGSYPVGTVLYCSTTAGELTVNTPAPPNHRIAIAVVTKQNANSGRIFVRTYTPGYDFNSLSDFQNSKRDPGMALTWNGTAAGFAVPTGGYTPPGSPPPGGYTPAVFYRSSTGGFEIDEDLTWVAGTNTLTTINVTGSGTVKGTNTYGARFATEAATNRALANATGITVERYFTCTAEGNGESFNIQSNTPSAGNKIVRKIWYKNEAFEATDVNTWTLIHTFADNATYASTATQWAATLEAQTYGKPPFTLALSWQDVPAFTGLLDTYGGAAAAYSVRLLDKDYAGSCIRVRRASDNTEQDIGFTGAGDLDTGALASFCAGTNGFVRTWYDQSGNARNATQTTTANQPKIYDSSTGVVTENGKPAVQFDGSADYLDFSLASANNYYYSVFAVRQSSSTSAMFLGAADTNRYWADFGDDGNTASTLQDGFNGPSLATDYSIYRKNGAAAFTTTTTRDQYHTAYYDGNQTLMAFLTDGSPNGSFSFTSLRLGAYQGPSLYFGGTAQEFILYTSTSGNQSSNAANIESNINDYFNIF